MTIKKGQEIELEIQDLAFGGRGLARIDGMAVFVKQAVPKDRVKARIMKKKKSFAEAHVVELLEPSPFRVTAPCPYSGLCGGCTWQFLEYEKQLVFKRAHVLDAIEHIGLLRDVPVHPTIPSPRRFEYRNKMEFTCSDRRWVMPDEIGKADVDTSVAVGLHVPGTFYKVLDTAACHLQPELGNRILEDFRSYIRSSGSPIYGLRSHEGFWRFLMLRHSVAHNQWMVNIVTASEDTPTIRSLADRLTDAYPAVVSVVNNITARKAGIAVGEYEIQVAGDRTIADSIGRYVFEISANSFFQTNTRNAARLYETVKDFAELTGTEKIIDLYSGAGTIPIYLSEGAMEIVGFEIIESAVSDAVRNCELNAVDNCSFILGDIKDRLAQIEISPDVMVIDPPRSGMHKDVVRQVLDMAPRKIVYVSCNPATLARDLGMMKERFRVSQVQPIDMFPHTFHIEAVAKLERR